MDRVTLDDLKSLASHEATPSVSIYMPLHRAVNEAQQDSVHLRHLVDQAESRLIADGMRAPDAAAFLKKARVLAADSLYWKPNSGAGLCLLIGPNFFSQLRLPFSCAESVHVGNRFHIAPLARGMTRDDRFLLLAISQKSVRLFQYRHGKLSPVNLPASMPKSMNEALSGTEIEKSLHYHTSATKGAGGAEIGILHGHGDPKDDQKTLIAEYLRILSRHLEGVLNGERVPLVLAAVNYLHPMFSAACYYPNIVQPGVQGSPDELSDQEMLERALPLVEPLARRRLDAAAERYRKSLGTDRINRHLEQILPAASQGRVEALFAAQEKPVWGRFDGTAGNVTIHDAQQPGDIDLVDEAVRSVVLTGGEVFVVAPEEVPDNGPTAALMRW